MKCNNCSSDRILGVGAKHSDLLSLYYTEWEHHGYGIGNIVISEAGGDYLDFELCLECGQVQGDWPVADNFIKEFE